jgi:hypothetical protein
MRVSRYESASSKGKGYVGEINNGIYTLDGTKKNLITYSNKISTSRTELATIKNDFGNLKNLDAEVLVNPIVIRNTPTYVPQVPEGFVEEFKGGTESEQAKQIVKGVNLISLQTVFPTILLLITFFLSLLISTFICLSEINSPAYKRINLIKGIFFPALLSVYISSIIIVMLPLFCILLLGNFLFNLAIFPNIFCVGIVLFFLSSIFIVTGMALAYLIKRESTTMLVTAFILVFLIFFSGFLLPTERMREISGVFADNFPGKIALSAFNKVVFYNHGVPIIAHELNVLLAWLIGVIAAAILVKKLRKA